MTEQTEQCQAKEYVYNLGNCAKENGFKPDESWELSLATGVEKSAIERNYYPSLSTKMLPERLASLLALIKIQMREVKMNFGSMPLRGDVVPGDLQYIVAFNPARQRR